MDYSSYYDFQWQQTGGKQHPYVAEKTNIILDIIPPDVRTIIDVGCGDGTITNVLAERYSTAGIDTSREGLKNLSKKAQPVFGSADCLPFKSNCVDLSLSSELLEHLPEEVFLGAISEMKRISRKHILITVPNNEHLRRRYAKCMACGFEFHVYCHLRTFNLNKLERYFSGYTIAHSSLCGAPDEKSFDLIYYLRNRLANQYCIDTISTLCPHCGTVISPLKSNLPQRLVGHSLFLLQNWLNVLLLRKPEPDWLVVLLEKTQER